MPVPVDRRTTAVRTARNPAVLTVALVLVAATGAASATVAQPSRQRRATTVFTAADARANPGSLSGGVGTTLAGPPMSRPSSPAPDGPAPASTAPSPPAAPLPAAPLPPASVPSPVAVALPVTAPLPETPTRPETPALPAPVPVEETHYGADAAIAYAKRQLGKPYRYGATGDSAFDCSGLVMRAWEQGGVSLPRTTFEMVHAGTRITRTQLRPGDLVFSNGNGHVQLYIGDGQVIEAPHAGARVRVGSLPSTAAYVRVG